MVCSGWQYRDWRGVVYPAGLPQRAWFAWYAEHFDSVEVNNTFYRLPAPATVDSWAATVPPGFTFSLKLGAFGIAPDEAGDAALWLPNHLDRLCSGSERPSDLASCNCRPAGDATTSGSTSSCRCVLPSSMRWAVEVREPSGLDDSVFEVLRRHGAAPACTTSLLIIRGCGRPTGATSASTAPTPWSDKDQRPLRRPAPLAHRRTAGRRLDEGCGVYAYFNNDYDGNAVADAQWLREAIDRR